MAISCSASCYTGGKGCALSSDGRCYEIFHKEGVNKVTEYRMRNQRARFAHIKFIILGFTNIKRKFFVRNVLNL